MSHIIIIIIIIIATTIIIITIIIIILSVGYWLLLADCSYCQLLCCFGAGTANRPVSQLELEQEMTMYKPKDVQI